MSILSVPLKTILPWHADIQNDTPPSDYAICDGSTLNTTQQDINPGGSYTVPDLRNTFLIGADATKTAGTAGVAVGNGNIEVAAGAPGPKGAGGENDHVLTVAELAQHSHVYPLRGAVSPSGVQDRAAYAQGGTNDALPPTVVTGNDLPHENRPKYYGVVFIMKVKY